jgi:hypothetical protein
MINYNLLCLSKRKSLRLNLDKRELSQIKTVLKQVASRQKTNQAPKKMFLELKLLINLIQTT